MHLRLGLRNLQAARYERSEARQGYRSGHYDRNLTTTSGDVTLHMPRLKGVSFETAIIERYAFFAQTYQVAVMTLKNLGDIFTGAEKIEQIPDAMYRLHSRNVSAFLAFAHQ